MSAKLGSSITAIGTVKASVRPSSGVFTIRGCLSIELKGRTVGTSELSVILSVKWGSLYIHGLHLYT